jgi:hypothetical protein
MRSAIDVLLDRAVAQWRTGPRDDRTVILVATLDDSCLRIRATASAARARAAALAADGWAVEVCDLTEAPAAPDGPGSVGGIAGAPDDPFERPSIPVDDLPSLPPVAIDRLRDTA